MGFGLVLSESSAERILDSECRTLFAQLFGAGYDFLQAAIQIGIPRNEFFGQEFDKGISGVCSHLLKFANCFFTGMAPTRPYEMSGSIVETICQVSCADASLVV